MSDEQAPDEETSEAINREQQDDGQAHDVADSARHGERSLGESRRAPGNRAQIIPDDLPDLIDTMNAMVKSGVIDNGAFAGEPQHDDEESILGETEDGGDEALFNAMADGNEDPLSVPIALPDLSDDGNDPLAKVSSEHGLEDEDSDDDDGDYDDADDDDLAGNGPKDDEDADDVDADDVDADDEEEDEEDEADPDPDWDRDGRGDRANPMP